jgi:hypothetical protein
VTRSWGTRTVKRAVAVFSSLVARTSVVPRARAVTSPVVLTTAIVVSSVLHAIVRPESTAPAPSLGVATKRTVSPRATLAESGAISTDATGTRTTVICDVPLLGPLVAVIVATPGAMPVTLAVAVPVEATIATASLLLPHEMTLLVGAPFAL